MKDPRRSPILRLAQAIIKPIARPTLTGLENLPDGMQVVYVLQQRAITDLVVLELACEAHGLTSPLDPLQFDDYTEQGRVFGLFHTKAGRITMQSLSERLDRLLQAPEQVRANTLLVPVSVFWGRAMSAENSWLRNLAAEDWAVTGRFKRLLNLVINRRNIFVHTGRPISLAELTQDDVAAPIALRRAARLLRVRLRRQRVNALGPDFSHRRTMLDGVVRSRQVREQIESLVASGAKPQRVQRRALKYARSIASHMSHPTIRVLARLLSWFWTKIYDGLDVSGLERIEAISDSHSLLYLPSHRSHIDYLVLSYLLYYRGFMIPHIASGDNLNLPVVGALLRRAGAFYMRRSFRDDPLYAAVFNEYLYQVYRRGHCVEFFPEGGRSRTGRLLPARLGLLKMTVDHQRRGLPRPLALVPVYFSYEKLIEASSYLSELRGEDKRKESLGDVLRNIRLIRQNFGHLAVKIGEPIELDNWLATRAAAHDDELLPELGRQIMISINRQAHLNPVNLVSLVTLATPNLAIEESQLARQIECYQRLLSEVWRGTDIDCCNHAPDQIIQQVRDLGLLSATEEPFGTVLGHNGSAAVWMTWYRNNVAHTLALPSLVACLMVNRRRGLDPDQLEGMASMVYPYLASELSSDPGIEQLHSVIDAMTGQGLLIRKGGQLHPPRPAEPQHLRLSLLARIIGQTLERMFIVIQQFSEGPISRQELLSRSQLIAQKISRLYGINAPEFSDQRLFDQFTDKLLDNGMLHLGQDQLLHHEPTIDRVLRAAEFVIDPQIRYGILSARNQA